LEEALDLSFDRLLMMMMLKCKDITVISRLTRGLGEVITEGWTKPRCALLMGKVGLR